MRSAAGLAATALLALGCAGKSDVAARPPAPPAVRVLPDGCPYATVHVAVSTNGAPMDAEVAGRVEDTYAETLGEQGFQLAPVPEEAYWSAFSMVRMSPRVDSVFSWSVYMMASQDLLGHVQAPIRFASVADDAAERSGYMLLKEVRLLELQAEVRQAAEATAFALLPHAARMCTAWETEPADQQSPSFRQVRSTGDLLEKLREELAREIIRMRRQRQQRIIEVELEPSS